MNMIPLYRFFSILLWLTYLCSAQAGKAVLQEKILDVEKFKASTMFRDSKGVSSKLISLPKGKVIDTTVQPFPKHKYQFTSVIKYLKTPVNLTKSSLIRVRLRKMTKGLGHVVIYISSHIDIENGRNLEPVHFYIPGGTEMDCDIKIPFFKLTESRNTPEKLMQVRIWFIKSNKLERYQLNGIETYYDPAIGSPQQKLVNNSRKSIILADNLCKMLKHEKLTALQKAEYLKILSTIRKQARKILAGEIKSSFPSLRKQTEQVLQQAGKIFIDSGKVMRIWHLPYYKSISPDTQITFDYSPCEHLDTKMAINEFKNRAFIVNACKNDIKLDVKFESKDIPSEAIDLYYLGYYYIQRNKTNFGDLLYKINGPLNIKAGKNQQIWLRFNSRYNKLRPGVYNFKIKLTDSITGTNRTIPGKLTVWDFELPGYKDIHLQCFAQFFSGDFLIPEVMDNAVREMKPYGLNYSYVYPHLMPWPAKIDADDKIISLNTKGIETHVKRVLEVYNSMPGKERLKFLFNINYLDKHLTKDKDIPYRSERWNKIFAQWLSKLQTLLKSYGLNNEDYYFVLGDEASLSHLETNEIPLAETIKKYHPHLKIYTNSSAIIEDDKLRERYQNAFDIFQPEMKSLDSQKKLQNFYSTNHKLKLSYKCDFVGSLTTNLYDYYRVFGWKNFKYGMKGFGVWTYCAQGTSPWSKKQSMVGYCLIYKAKDSNKVIHTRRYELYREGADDYRYLIKLKNLAANKDIAVRQRTEKLFKTAINDIESNINDTARCEKWRTRIANEILKLK